MHDQNFTWFTFVFSSCFFCVFLCERKSHKIATPLFFYSLCVNHQQIHTHFLFCILNFVLFCFLWYFYIKLFVKFICSFFFFVFVWTYQPFIYLLFSIFLFFLSLFCKCGRMDQYRDYWHKIFCISTYHSPQ